MRMRKRERERLISPSGSFVGSEQSRERFVFIFLAGSYRVTVTDTSQVFSRASANLTHASKFFSTLYKSLCVFCFDSEERWSEGEEGRTGTER